MKNVKAHWVIEPQGYLYFSHSEIDAFAVRRIIGKYAKLRNNLIWCFFVLKIGGTTFTRKTGEK